MNIFLNLLFSKGMPRDLQNVWIWFFFQLKNSENMTTNLLDYPSWKQDINWKYIRHSEAAQDVFWESYVPSIYVLEKHF